MTLNILQGNIMLGESSMNGTCCKERVVLAGDTYLESSELENSTEFEYSESQGVVILPLIGELASLASLEYDDLQELKYSPPFGYSPKLFVPEINTDATDFMVLNMKEIKDSIVKMGVDNDKVHDLYSDVFISLKEEELEGRGYDPSCGTDLRQFVFGRVKGYSKNKKYDSRYVETKSGCTLIAASDDQSDEDKLNGFQAAYKNAASSDEIELLESALSVKDAIETCLDFCHNTSFNIISLFRCVESIDSMIKPSRNRKGANSIFSDIRQIGFEHPEFFEAMQLALQFRAVNKDLFMRILDATERDINVC